MKYLISTAVLEAVAAAGACDEDFLDMLRHEIARRGSEAAQRDKAAMS